MTDNEEMKRRQYEIRIMQIRKKSKLPHLTTQQTLDLIDRLMKIPGTVDDVDLRTVIRLYCREMKCTTQGPIYE